MRPQNVSTFFNTQLLSLSLTQSYNPILIVSYQHNIVM